MKEEHGTGESPLSLACVLPVAEAMMASEGLHAVSVSRVSRATGYPVEALAKYFPTRSALRGTILLRHATALLKRLREVLGTSEDPLAKIRIDLQCKLAYAEENPIVIKLFQSRLPHAYEDPLDFLPEPAAFLWRKYHFEELEWIQQAQRQRRIRIDLSPASVQQLMRVMVQWSFDDPEFREMRDGCRFTVLWGLFGSTLGIPMSDTQRW